jgi:DNA-binding PadR family transcriptional regulator
MDTITFAILVSVMQGAESAGEILDGMLRVSRQRRKPPLASLYRALKRALEAGWLELDQAAPAGNRGRPSQVYRITRQGEKAVRSEAGRLQHMASLALTPEISVQRGSG